MSGRRTERRRSWLAVALGGHSGSHLGRICGPKNQDMRPGLVDGWALLRVTDLAHGGVVVVEADLCVNLPRGQHRHARRGKHGPRPPAAGHENGVSDEPPHQPIVSASFQCGTYLSAQ